MRILVTGGTGLIGRAVVERLTARGDSVVLVSRRPGANAERLTYVNGDPSEAGPWLDEVRTCDAVFHLAGEPVAQRWTTKARQRILDSRVTSTTLIANTLAEVATNKVLICSSGIGYYGASRNNATEFTENDLPGTGFLANVCVAWEQATQAATTAGVRVANVRTGMVLAAHGGALPTIAKPFRFFVGGVIGGGKQWMSWIHLTDMADLLVFLLDHPDARGPFNAVAPEPLTNWGFSHTLAKVLRRPCLFPVPAFAVRLLMGGMAELATHGQRVLPMRAQQLGFPFRFPLLEPALRDVYAR